MPEALCFLCFLSIVYLQTYPSVRYRGVLPAGVADATPATASPCRRLSLRTSPSRPALRYSITSVNASGSSTMLYEPSVSAVCVYRK